MPNLEGRMKTLLGSLLSLGGVCYFGSGFCLPLLPCMERTPGLEAGQDLWGGRDPPHMLRCALVVCSS